MEIIESKYQDIREEIQAGDLMCFGGNSITSDTIKFATRCNVSHVGTVFDAQVPTVQGTRVVQIIESTSLGDGVAGVKFNRLSNHIEYYDGDIWWMPLSFYAKVKLDQQAFYSFLLSVHGTPYDASQAIGSALDFLPDNKEDYSKLFCSELVAAAYEKGGLITDINASEQTPADICRLPFFKEFHHLRGDAKEIFR